MLIFLLTSIAFGATPLSSSLNFNVDENKSITQEIQFINESNQVQSLSFQIENRLPETGASSKFSVVLNRCLNMRPGKTCKVTVRNGRLGPGMHLAQLNYGEGVVNLSAVVPNPTPPAVIISALPLSLNFSLMGTEKRNSAAQVVIIKNSSAVSVSPVVTLTGPAFKVLTNRCATILPNKSCEISLYFSSVESSLKTGELKVGSLTIPLSGRRIIDVLPSFMTSSQDIEVMAGASIDIPADLITGGNIQWTVSSPLQMMGDRMTLLTTPVHVGKYTVTLQAENSAGAATKAINLTIKPYVEMSSLNFNEGELKLPLALIKIKSGKVLQHIDGNFSQFFTTVRAKKNAVSIDNFTAQQVDPEMDKILIQEASVSQFTTISLEGTVKFKTNSNLTFSLKDADDNEYNYSYPIVVTGKNLPYVRYDIYAVKGDTATGDNPSGVFENVADYNRLTENWRTPILVRYKVRNLNCGSGNIQDYIGDVQYHENCVSDNVSPDAETTFWFNDTYSTAGSAIGGRAQGIRHGIVIAKNTWTHTLAHELGHNFGLFHTFENFKNPYLFHVDLFRNSYKKTKVSDNNIYVGDWAGFLFDWFSSTGTISFNYSAADDTALDLYGAKRVLLNSPAEQFGVLLNGVYRNGDAAFLSYGTQSDFDTAYACRLGIYNSQNRAWSTICTSGETLAVDSVRNFMSYWYKYQGDAVITTNQKQRMDDVLNSPAYQFLGVQ